MRTEPYFSSQGHDYGRRNRSQRLRLTPWPIYKMVSTCIAIKSPEEPSVVEALYDWRKAIDLYDQARKRDKDRLRREARRIGSNVKDRLQISMDAGRLRKQFNIDESVQSKLRRIEEGQTGLGKEYPNGLRHFHASAVALVDNDPGITWQALFQYLIGRFWINQTLVEFLHYDNIIDELVRRGVPPSFIRPLFDDQHDRESSASTLSRAVPAATAPAGTVFNSPVTVSGPGGTVGNSGTVHHVQNNYGPTEDQIKGMIMELARELPNSTAASTATRPSVPHSTTTQPIAAVRPSLPSNYAVSHSVSYPHPMNAGAGQQTAPPSSIGANQQSTAPSFLGLSTRMHPSFGSTGPSINAQPLGYGEEGQVERANGNGAGVVDLTRTFGSDHDDEYYEQEPKPKNNENACRQSRDDAAPSSTAQYFNNNSNNENCDKNVGGFLGSLGSSPDWATSVASPTDVSNMKKHWESSDDAVDGDGALAQEKESSPANEGTNLKRAELQSTALGPTIDSFDLDLEKEEFLENEFLQPFHLDHTVTSPDGTAPGTGTTFNENAVAMATKMLDEFSLALPEAQHQTIKNKFGNFSHDQLLRLWLELSPLELPAKVVKMLQGVPAKNAVSKDRTSPATPATDPSSSHGLSPVPVDFGVNSGIPQQDKSHLKKPAASPANVATPGGAWQGRLSSRVTTPPDQEAQPRLFRIGDAGKPKSRTKRGDKKQGDQKQNIKKADNKCKGGKKQGGNGGDRAKEQALSGVHRGKGHSHLEQLLRSQQVFDVACHHGSARGIDPGTGRGGNSNETPLTTQSSETATRHQGTGDQDGAVAKEAIRRSARKNLGTRKQARYSPN